MGEYKFIDKIISDDKIYDITGLIKHPIYLYIFYDHGIGIDATYEIGFLSMYKNYPKRYICKKEMENIEIKFDGNKFIIPQLISQNLRLSLLPICHSIN